MASLKTPSSINRSDMDRRCTITQTILRYRKHREKHQAFDMPRVWTAMSLNVTQRSITVCNLKRDCPGRGQVCEFNWAFRSHEQRLHWAPVKHSQAIGLIGSAGVIRFKRAPKKKSKTIGSPCWASWRGIQHHLKSEIKRERDGVGRERKGLSEIHRRGERNSLL